jgi:hypothetical protein
MTFGRPASRNAGWSWREAVRAGSKDRSYDKDVAAHVNRRGWIVLTSVASADGSRCVDVFARPHGGFGFEEFRSDPEDMGRWTAVAGHSALHCSTATEAATRGIETVTWLGQEPRTQGRAELLVQQRTEDDWLTNGGRVGSEAGCARMQLSGARR